jgi:hypothetical protein
LWIGSDPNVAYRPFDPRYSEYAAIEELIRSLIEGLDLKPPAVVRVALSTVTV